MVGFPSVFWALTYFHLSHQKVGLDLCNRRVTRDSISFTLTRISVATHTFHGGAIDRIDFHYKMPQILSIYFRSHSLIPSNSRGSLNLELGNIQLGPRGCRWKIAEGDQLGPGSSGGVSGSLPVKTAKGGQPGPRRSGGMSKCLPAIGYESDGNTPADDLALVCGSCDVISFATIPFKVVDSIDGLRRGC